MPTTNQYAVVSSPGARPDPICANANPSLTIRFDSFEAVGDAHYSVLGGRALPVFPTPLVDIFVHRLTHGVVYGRGTLAVFGVSDNVRSVPRITFLQHTSFSLAFILWRRGGGSAPEVLLVHHRIRVLVALGRSVFPAGVIRFFVDEGHQNLTFQVAFLPVQVGSFRELTTHTTATVSQKAPVGQLTPDSFSDPRIE